MYSTLSFAITVLGIISTEDGKACSNVNHESYPLCLTNGHSFYKEPLQTEPLGSPSCYNHAS